MANLASISNAVIQHFQWPELRSVWDKIGGPRVISFTSHFFMRSIMDQFPSRIIGLCVDADDVDGIAAPIPRSRWTYLSQTAFENCSSALTKRWDSHCNCQELCTFVQRHHSRSYWGSGNTNNVEYISRLTITIDLQTARTLAFQPNSHKVTWRICKRT